MGSPAPQAATQYQQNLSKGFAPAVGVMPKNVQVRKTATNQAPKMSVNDGISRIFQSEGYSSSKPETTEKKFTGSFVYDPNAQAMGYVPKEK